MVMDPDDKVLLEGSGERQGDYIFTANKVGVEPSGASSQLLRLRWVKLTQGRLANTHSVLKTRPTWRKRCST